MAKVKPISTLTEHLHQRIIKVRRVFHDHPPRKILFPRKYLIKGAYHAYEHASLFVSQKPTTPLPNRLERPQVEALITYLAGGKALPAEVVAHIVTKTDGVPLFVEEPTKTAGTSRAARTRSTTS